MKIVMYIIASFVLAIIALVILGQILPRPATPAAGQIIRLQSGVDINAYQRGEGETVVLVHGLPGSAHDWNEIVDALVARGFHVVWYDRVGYGHSSRRAAPETAHTMQVNGDELDQLISAMDLDNPALIGWSFGGGTVQSSQAARSESTPFIVLMGSVGPSMNVDEKPVNPPGTGAIMRMPLLGKPISNAIISSRFNDPVPKAWQERFRVQLLMKGALATLDAEMAQINPAALRPSSIQTPTLIIHGRKDKVVPYDVAVDLGKRMENAVLLTMDEAGHMLPIYPESVADAVRAFADAQVD